MGRLPFQEILMTFDSYEMSPDVSRNSLLIGQDMSYIYLSTNSFIIFNH